MRGAGRSQRFHDKQKQADQYNKRSVDHKVKTFTGLSTSWPFNSSYFRYRLLYLGKKKEK